MSAAALQAWFEANKPVALGAAAAGVAGLALLQKKKKAAPAAAAGPSPAGTIPAAAVVPATQAGGSFPDSSAYDVYNALQSELSPFLTAQQAQTGTSSGGAANAVPSGPVASSLLAPTGNGQLVRYGSQIGEVESDGSVYGLSLPEWQALGSPSNFVQLGATAATAPAMSTRASNLAAKIKGAATSAATAPAG